MQQTSQRWVALLVVMLLVVGASSIVWSLSRTRVLFSIWSTVSEWPLNKSERLRVADCRPLGWWTWLKIVARDQTPRCGEVWTVGSLAGKVHGDVREAWLKDWVEAEASTPLRRLRSSLALTVAGRVSPREPAWLSLATDLPPLAEPGLAAAVAQDAEWGVHLGPHWMALGELWAVSVSGYALEHALEPLEAVRVLDEPAARREAAVAVARALGVSSDLAEDARHRRRRGLGVRDYPADWAWTIQRHPTCEAPCLDLWADLLRVEIDREYGEPRNEPDVDPALEPLGRLIGYDKGRAAGLAWWLGAATRWVAAAPDPAGRLASLGLGSPDGEPDPVRVVFDRGGTPWATVAVLDELGRRAGVSVEIRLDRTGGLWAAIGEHRRSGTVCGGSAQPASPAGNPLGRIELHAAALAEAAARAAADEEPIEALRLATAAEGLAPDFAAGVLSEVRALIDAPDELGQGFGVGRALVEERPPGPLAATLTELCQPRS